MIRRVSLPWPGSRSNAEHQQVRLLAVSDAPEQAFDFVRNREQVGKVDAVLGCGDLEPDYLAFLADAFRVPLIYVRGNHDRGLNWEATSTVLPGALIADFQKLGAIELVGLSWPGNERSTHAIRDENAAWGQAIRVAAHRPRQRPVIVLSHVPPRGLGDTPEDDYHRGFAGYQWLCRRLRPTVWLHGHTSLAAASDWRVKWGETTLVNVTGAVVVEIGQGTSPAATISATAGGAA